MTTIQQLRALELKLQDQLDAVRKTIRLLESTTQPPPVVFHSPLPEKKNWSEWSRTDISKQLRRSYVLQHVDRAKADFDTMGQELVRAGLLSPKTAKCDAGAVVTRILMKEGFLQPINELTP